MSGGRIDIEVGLDMAALPAQLQAGMQPALGAAKKMAGAFGVALGVAGAVGTVKQIVQIGNDYTTSLNTMQAVSKATAEQMAAVSGRAKELGNDIALPGTSASDAAAAMTELAKGGFSVEESMAAAKGTLQLAAAAQIDAAQAATIQSQALQAFGKDATFAGTAADILANTANASSAEMTDVAYGLQQAGTVANQFGVSMQDTATTIGLFANAGITGSDAGTLLKSALLALTDQGKPAQAAIEELGLTVYDAQGKFVGMQALFGQLETASKSMTDEQYQAATATLFGSDAMRLAGVAAEQGVAGYDRMRAAIDRHGAAAEVAAAKTQGLPGALGAAQNSVESLALSVYDLVDGPMASFARTAAEQVAAATPAIVDGLSTVGGAVGEVGSMFMDLPGSVQLAVAGFAGIKALGLDETIGGWTRSARASMAGFREEMTLQQALAAGTGASYDGLGESVTRTGDRVRTVSAAFATLEARVPVVGQMGEAYRSVTTRTSEFASQQQALGIASGGLSGQLRFAAASASNFGGALGGTVAAGVRGASSAIGGVVSALGGPWMAGLAVAGLGLSAWMASVSEANALTKQYDDAVRRIAVSQNELGDILARSGGKFDDLALANVTSQVTDLSSALDAAGKNDARWTNVATDMLGDVVLSWRGASDDISKEKDRIALDNRQAAEAMKNLEMTDQQVAQAMTDNAAWGDVEAKLRGMGDGGQMAADKLNETRDKVIATRDAAQNTTPGFFGLTAAVKTLADASASAADRTSALKAALDILSGKPVDVGAAMQSYNRQVRETAAATQEAWDKTQGWGQALLNQDGSVNSATANGDRLLTALNAIKDSTVQAAASGADMAPIWAQNEEQFRQLATATGLSADQIRRMAEQAGLVPANIEMLASLKGADSVEQQLLVVKSLLDQNREGVEIPTDALTDETKRKLEEVGVKIDTDINGKPGIVKLSAPNEQALAAIQAVIDKNIPNKTVTITIDAVATAAAQRAFNASGQEGPVAPVLRPPGRATGGPIEGPGTPTSDSILGIDRVSGLPTAWVSTKEFVVNAAAYAKHPGLVEAINRDDPALAGLPAFAGGGAVDRIRGVGDRMQGVTYAWGGAGWGGADCSGYVAMLQRAAMGEEDPQGRLGTTLDLLAGRWPGLVPGTKGPFVVGVNEEHMAATIFDRNYESGGAYGAAMQGGTVGAFDPQFTARYYLPWELFSPPITAASMSTKDYLDSAAPSSGETARDYASKKKATWTEKDDEALNSAQIAITQAEEARARVNADEKKSQADRDQAESKVKRAKLRVKELEAKKDAAASGRDALPAPSAPDLETALSDEQLELRRAERAVAKAERDRNEAYDDPESTQESKDEADDALQAARNRLAEVSKGKPAARGGGSLPTSWSEAFGLIAQDFASSTLSDVLGYYGASDDMGPLLSAGMSVAKAAQDGFTGEKKPPLPEASLSAALAQSQLPVTPGTPDWMANILKALDVRVFDDGGPLEPGQLGLNLSNRREFVLNPRETEDMEQTKRMFQALRADGAPTPAPVQEQAPAADPFASARDTVFQLPNGFDPNAIATGIRRAKQQESFEQGGTRI